jgi:hypothetical protein
MQMIGVYREAAFPLQKSFLQLRAGVVNARFGEYLIVSYELILKDTPTEWLI